MRDDNPSMEVFHRINQLVIDEYGTRLDVKDSELLTGLLLYTIFFCRVIGVEIDKIQPLFKKLDKSLILEKKELN